MENTIHTTEWQIVFESPSKGACSDRSLVLHSLDIPCEIVFDEAQYQLVVPETYAEKARYELWQYQQENVKTHPESPRIEVVYQNSTPGIVGYVAVISVVALLAGEAAFDFNWFVAGRVDGVLIRTGEWWRTVTALTLHSGLRHFAGNLGFGILFGVMAGRIIGPGVTWFAVVLSSSLANFINTLLLDSTHRSIGASTAVFATLGLLAGFVWRAKLMAQDRWPYRIGPIVGGLALLAYTGSGDANTDVGAHVVGFFCGFVTGTALTLVYRFIPKPRVQIGAGFLAIATLIVAWVVALQHLG